MVTVDLVLQIYGEDEKIYGYKNLTIDVHSRRRFLSYSLTALTNLPDPVKVRVRLITPVPKRPLRVKTRIFLDSGQRGKHSC